MAAELPSGTVAFLLTDLEGSTRMWEQDPVAMKAAMVRHDEILEKTIAGQSGFRVLTDGRRHGRRVRDGQGCRRFGGMAIQEALAAEKWGTARAIAGPNRAAHR